MGEVRRPVLVEAARLPRVQHDRREKAPQTNRERREYQLPYHPQKLTHGLFAVNAVPRPGEASIFPGTFGTVIQPAVLAFAAFVLLFALAACGGERSAEGPPAAEPTTAETPARNPALAYVSLGDSLAVGVGASDLRERGYAPLYRDLLERKSGREVQLPQLGVSGETTGCFINGPDPQLARAESV